MAYGDEQYEALDNPKPAPKVQVDEKGVADLMELLDGYKTMLLAHERRIGVIETLLAEAIRPQIKLPQDHRRKQK